MTEKGEGAEMTDEAKVPEPVAFMYVTRYNNKVLSFQRIPESARHDYYAEYPLVFKEQSSYAKIFDTIHGTPCEQIRFQQKIEELECKLSEEKEITQRLALELQGYREAETDINSALNSGNGTYSP